MMPRASPAIGPGLFLAIIALLGACRGDRPAPPRLSPTAPFARVTDYRGTLRTLPRRPERIVVAGTPLYTEALFDLHAGERLVGVTDSADNPPEAAGLPRIGAWSGLRLEDIVALRPDLVLGAQGAQEELLARAGLPVVTLGYAGGSVDSIGDVYRLLRDLGVLVHGAAGPGDELSRRIRGEVGAIEARVRPLRRPRAALLYPMTGTAPTVAAAGTPEAELLQRAGADNAFADLHLYPQVSFEELCSRDPEVLLVEKRDVAAVLENPLLGHLRAVQEGKVFGIHASRMVSSRVSAALLELAQTLHPEAFAPMHAHK